MKEKIINYFEKIKKKKKKTNKLFYNKIKQKSILKKRKNINIKLDIFKYNKFFKKNYIPYILISFVIFLIIIIFIIIWPIFKVKYIEIIKKDNVTNMEIAYKAADNYRWKSIFKIDEKEVYNRFRSYQENIKSIDLSLKMPNTLKIETESYKEIYNINIRWKDYILLENGVIIPTRHSKNLNTLNIIKEFDKNSFYDYEKIIDPKYTDRIKYIEKSIKENILWIQINEIKYYVVERELHFITESWNTIIFSINTDLESVGQIKSLSIFNKEHTDIQSPNIIYIDLRVENKVFLCEKTDKNNYCDKNIKSIYDK